MRAIAVIVVLLAGVIAAAQSKSKESALRKILDDEITTWKQGDTDGYSEHFAADGTFTNVMGMFLPGGRHSMTVTRSFLRGPFRGTLLQLQVVSLRFLTSDVAACETLTWVSGFKNGSPPGLHLDTKGPSAHVFCKCWQGVAASGRSSFTTMSTSSPMLRRRNRNSAGKGRPLSGQRASTPCSACRSFLARRKRTL